MESFISLVDRFVEIRNAVEKRCNTVVDVVQEHLYADERLTEASVLVSVKQPHDVYARHLSVSFYEVADLPAKLSVQIPYEVLDTLAAPALTALANEVAERVLAHRAEYARKRDEALREYHEQRANGAFKILHR